MYSQRHAYPMKTAVRLGQELNLYFYDANFPLYYGIL